MLSASSAGRWVQIGGIICPARGGGGAWPVQRSAAAWCDLLPARHHRAATEKPPTENGQQKRGRRGAGRVYLFFRVKFSGGWNHPPPVLLSSGGWNPSRAILSRVAFTIYPATLSPAWAAAVFKSSSISFGILIDFVANFDK
jgi:hypothetical protein